MPPPVCEAHGCNVALGPNNPSGLCYQCSTELVHSAHELEKELDRFLSLEAQFVAWCLEHGQPNPHDD